MLALGPRTVGQDTRSSRLLFRVPHYGGRYDDVIVRPRQWRTVSPAGLLARLAIRGSCVDVPTSFGVCRHVHHVLCLSQLGLHLGLQLGLQLGTV